MHKNIPIITYMLLVFVVPVFAGPADTVVISNTYCDSAVRFNNTYSVHTDIYDTICQNDLPYHFISGQIDTTFQTLEAPLSTFNFYFLSQSDCDSIVTLNLTVNPIPELPSVTAATRCGPGPASLVPNNTTLCHWYATPSATSYTETDTLVTETISESTSFFVSNVDMTTGCESGMVEFPVIIYPVPDTVVIYDSVCLGTTYTEYNLNVSYNTAGVKIITLSPIPSFHGCDSVRELHLNVLSPPAMPLVSTEGHCGAGIVTLQAVVGQNGTTCYWYDSENAADTIHSGTSFQPELSQTTVFYVASVNVETGCASARVADTAIIYSVPSSPSVNVAARCGAGPVTLNVTDEDTSWTVQWFADSTTADALATGLQYTTNNLDESENPYVYYVQCSDEHCQSSRVMLTVMVNAIPEMYAIIGDTLVCRNQYLEFRYPVEDTENYQYVWYSYFDPDSDSTFGYNLPMWERYIVDSVPQYVIVGMRVQDLQTNCLNDTTLAIHVCEGFSPDRTKVVRKNNSNILICDNSDFPDNVHYRWGYTNKFTFDENAYDWDYTYYQFSSIDTSHFRYWVETYVINGDVTCRNRTYYQDDIETGLDQLEQLDVMAFMRGNQLQIQVGNPSEQHTVAVLYDLSGRTIAQWDFGTASVIREQISFGYPNGIYLLTVQVGNRRHTTKLLSQQ